MVDLKLVQLASSFYKSLPKSPAYSFALVVGAIFFVDSAYQRKSVADDRHNKRTEQIAGIERGVQDRKNEYENIRYDIKVTATEELVRDLSRDVDSLASLQDSGTATSSDIDRLSKRRTELSLTRSKLDVMYARRPKK